MLHSFLRFFRSTETSLPLVQDFPPTSHTLPPQRTRPQRTRPSTAPRSTNIPQPIETESAPSSHRQRVLSMRLEHTRICSARRAERLAAVGIETAGDLASIDPFKIAQTFGAPKKAARVLQQYRRAVRFSASVPGMMPREAMLLVRIHRRSVRGLARETPTMLHRDLERFAESSAGRLALRGGRLPSIRRIKGWIKHCESMQLNLTSETSLA